MVARFRDAALDFVPGERWNYSNSGYSLLGLLIETVSGTSYAAFLRENIFVPLNMNDSGYDLSRDVILRRASGYRRAGAAIVNAPYLDMSLPYAAGGLYSTTGDLLTWTRVLFGGRVSSAASLKIMTTPVPPVTQWVCLRTQCAVCTGPHSDLSFGRHQWIHYHARVLSGHPGNDRRTLERGRGSRCHLTASTTTAPKTNPWAFGLIP